MALIILKCKLSKGALPEISKTIYKNINNIPYKGLGCFKYHLNPATASTARRTIGSSFNAIGPAIEKALLSNRARSYS